MKNKMGKKLIACLLLLALLISCTTPGKVNQTDNTYKEQLSQDKNGEEGEQVAQSEVEKEAEHKQRQKKQAEIILGLIYLIAIGAAAVVPIIMLF